MWLAADANYFTGGRTTIGGKQNLDLQRNSRMGATFSTAVSRQQAIRMSVSRGAVHDDRRRLHIHRGQLQLCMDAVKGRKYENLPHRPRR